MATVPSEPLGKFRGPVRIMGNEDVMVGKKKEEPNNEGRPELKDPVKPEDTPSVPGGVPPLISPPYSNPDTTQNSTFDHQKFESGSEEGEVRPRPKKKRRQRNRLRNRERRAQRELENQSKILKVNIGDDKSLEKIGAIISLDESGCSREERKERSASPERVWEWWRR